MADKSKVFVYPKEVSAFGFDWGKLALEACFPSIRRSRPEV